MTSTTFPLVGQQHWRSLGATTLDHHYTGHSTGLFREFFGAPATSTSALQHNISYPWPCTSADSNGTTELAAELHLRDSLPAAAGPWNTAAAPPSTAQQALLSRQQQQLVQAEPQAKATAQPKRSRAERTSSPGNGSSQKDAQALPKDAAVSIKALEAELQQKAAEYARLQQAHESLSFHHSVMVKVVRLRNDQLRLLHDGPDHDLSVSQLATLLNPGPAPAPAAPAMATPSPCDADFHVPMHVAAAPVLPSAELQPEALSLHARLLANEERAQFQGMRVDGFVELHWKPFFSEVSVQLLQLEMEPASHEAQRRLQQLCRAAAALVAYTSLLAPATMLGVLKVHLETLKPSSPPSSHWVDVACSLSLSTQQRKEMVAVYRLFQATMQGVLGERTWLCAQMAAGLGPKHGAAAPQRGMPAPGGASDARPAEIHVLLPALLKNLRREQAAHLLLRGYLLGELLEPVQLARAACFAYPYFPDATAIMAAVAGQQQEASRGC